ncbi:MAG TPA: DUF434 domain-containing protein [Verrucomicrobiae bacterium]|nr:DUF434 domain-containing protein [Verrucomicrobiae bacterium]
MAGGQTHRGAAPKDERLFGADQIRVLRAAAADLCWLLDRHYAARSAIELVGNRHHLVSRQRMALSRYACSAADVQRRAQSRREPADLRGQELWLDGYNILTVLESALAGAVVLPGRDGCYRDIAGMHRRYRRVNETLPALRIVGDATAALGVSRCRWLLDQPVSNSGRLKTLILEIARNAGWSMDVELTFSPDHLLARTNQIIATSDGIVLDRCRQWINLAGIIISERVPQANIVDLGPQRAPPG